MPLLLTLSLLWLPLIYNLTPYWTAYPQYHYAWAVPFLSLYLLWRRLPSAPPAVQPAAPKIASSLMILCALLLLPVRIIHEANPTWRLTSLLWTFQTVLLTCGLLYLAGGRPWLRHFAFPISFFLVALPWPSPMEQPLLQTLTRLVTRFTAELLSLAGIPTLQHANLLEIRTGFVGIDDVCSGIRSLQAALMLSLFFGEIYLLSPFRRFASVLAGFSLAFLFNLARTTLLTLIAARHGIEAITSWHDPAGTIILLACFGSLWALAKLLQHPGAPSAPDVSGFTSHASRFMPHVSPFPLFLPSAIALSLIGPPLFYHTIESRRPLLPAWTLALPPGNAPFEHRPFARSTHELLRFDHGQNITWDQPDGTRWQLFHLRWNAGRAAAHLARLHTPETCLPAQGIQMTPLPGIRSIQIDRTALPFRVFRVQHDSFRGYVFYCRWGDRGDAQTVEKGESSRWQRLRSVLHGRGNQGFQILEVVVWGIDSETEAQTALQYQLQRLLVSTR